MIRIYTTIFLLLFAFSAFAQSGPVVEIDKIVIVESRDGAGVGDVEPSTTVPVKTTAPKTSTVSEVISRTAGVHIRRYGGLEEATSISIRGSSHEQVQVVLDGVSFETASGEGIGLGHIPTATVSKVEVYKGFTPSDFGAQAVGGVVNIETKPIEKGVHHRYGLGVGSFLTFDALAEFSYGGDEHDVMFGMDYRRSKGNFSFLDDNGTPLNPTDDARVDRENNEHQLYHPYLKWLYRMDKRTEVSLAQHFFHINSGVPGLGSFQSKNASLATTETLSSLQIKRDGYFKGKGRFHNNLYLRWIKSQYADPLGEIGLGLAQDNNNNTIVFGDRFLWQTDFSKNFVLKNGAEYIFEWFLPKNWLAANPYGSSSKRQQLNLFLEPHLYLFDQKIRLSVLGQSLNAFYNINNNDPSLNTPGTFFSNRTENQYSGTFAVKYTPITGLHFKGSVGRVVRLPKFYEMFGDQGNVLGNPQLSSEKGVKFDVGVLWAQKFNHPVFKRFSLEANYFESHIDDLIQFEVASGFARANNIGEARIRGAELIVNAKILKYFELAANYTFQSAIDQAVFPGNELVGRPKHQANGELSFQYGPFSAGTHLNYIDGQYLDALNTQEVNNRVIVNFQAGYLIKEKVRLGFEAKNLTDSQVVDAVGFPLPGRSFFGRVDCFF